MFPIYRTFLDDKGNTKKHIFGTKDSLKNIDNVLTSKYSNCQYSLVELKIMKKYMETNDFNNYDKYIAKYIDCDSFSLLQTSNSLMYDNSGSCILSGTDDNNRVKNFIKCLDLLIEEKTK
jgi:hypothetical protein